LKDGLIAKYRFVENTLAVADAFRTDGVWHIATDGTVQSLPLSA
jgi:hypothetical protein